MRSIALLVATLLLTGCSPSPRQADPAAAEQPGTAERLLVDVTREAGLHRYPQTTGSAHVDYIIDSVGSGGAWLDYDNDGDPDLYLAQGATPENPTAGPPDHLLRNDGVDERGQPRFTEVTSEAGLGDTRWSFGVAAADYDNDGDTDLYLTNWGANRLYRNDGDGTFTDVAFEAAVADTGWGASASWSDVDRDGDLDLYLANYVVFSFDRYPARGEVPANREVCIWKGLEIFCGPRNLEPAHDRLFRNDGDDDGDGIPIFTDVSTQAGIALGSPLYSLAARFLDADDDGDDDLYVANDSVQNVFYVNDGTGHFDEQSILAGVAYNEQGNEQAGMGIGIADYDEDGRQDIVVTNFSHDHDTLYRNEGGLLFTDVSYRVGLGSASFFTLGWGLAFEDLDLDGTLDLFVAHGHVYPQVDGAELGTSYAQPNTLFLNRGGQFEAIDPPGQDWATTRSSRVVLPADIDSDGDLDLLVTHLNAAPDLLRNDANGSWLAVRLIGTRSNRDGIGAKVTLVAEDGSTRAREIRADAAYAGSVLPTARFGLGQATSVREVQVRWPSGVVSRLDAPTIDRVHVVREE